MPERLFDRLKRRSGKAGEPRAPLSDEENKMKIKWMARRLAERILEEEARGQTVQAALDGWRVRWLEEEKRKLVEKASEKGEPLPVPVEDIDESVKQMVKEKFPENEALVTVFLSHYAEALLSSIEFVLHSVDIDYLEIQFIWTYRRDYLHEIMRRHHLWLLLTWDDKVMFIVIFIYKSHTYISYILYLMFACALLQTGIAQMYALILSLL